MIFQETNNYYMVQARYEDKSLVVEILTGSFDENKSVNYIIKQDSKRVKRIKSLMNYSFEMCYRFGEVFLTEDRKGCALILMPDKKTTSLSSVLLDVQFISSGIGLSNVKKAMTRESKIKQLQLKGLTYYLWFIGVSPSEQTQGIGSKLMAEVIEAGHSLQRPICLETSTLKNIPWYEKFGFKIYNELDLGYKLFFMKKE